MKKSRTGQKVIKNNFSDPSEKRPRGRPARVKPSEVRGRADHFALIFEQEWEMTGAPLMQARTRERVLEALSKMPEYRRLDFQSLADLIAGTVSDPKFPKRRDPQIRFLADSLAALGRVSARRSRDICSANRAQVVHRIVRKDYYIECTCSYVGPALHGACPKCKTNEVDFSVEMREAFKGTMS